MMTISNPEWSSSFEKTPNRVRLNIKSVLFLLSIFGFGFNLTAQKTGDLNDLEQFKSKWMTEHQIKSMNADQYDQMKADWYETSDPIRQVKADPKEPYNQLRINQFLKWQGKDFASGFPAYELTGNDQMDKQIYDSKKQIWINNFPALYQKMTPDDGLTVSEREAIRANELNQLNLQK